MKKTLLCVVLAGATFALGGCSRPLGPTPPSAVSPPAVGITTETIDAAVAATNWMCVAAASEQSNGCPPRPQIRSRQAAATNAPAAPLHLAGMTSGSRVWLTWVPPAGGEAPTSFVIEAGSVPGSTDLANYDTGTATTAFISEGVPAGTYYVRVRAKNAAGVSPSSNEVVLSVPAGGCTGPPGASTGLGAAVTGSTVTLTWTAPVGPCAVTSYVVDAGTGASSSNVASFDTRSISTSYREHGVDPAVYYVRVRAMGTGGAGAASNEVTVTVLPTPLAATSFVAFGDSITAGASGAEADVSTSHISSLLSRFHPTVLLPVDERYPTVLQRLLAARYRTQMPSVRNEGVSGEAVTDPATLSRFANVIAGGQFSVVLIMEGTNDLHGPDATRIAGAIDGLREMVRQAKGRGVTPYLATIAPVNPEGFRGRNYAPESVALINEGIRALAIAENVTLADVFQGFGNNFALLDDDGLHPNADGYARIASVFYTAIKTTLETPSSASVRAAGAFRSRSPRR